MVEGFEDRIFAHKDVALDEVGNGFGDLVIDEGAGGDGEDVVEFFEGALFGFRDEEEDHYKGDDVETAVGGWG